jgi:hypothetical protein
LKPKSSSTELAGVEVAFLRKTQEKNEKKAITTIYLSASVQFPADPSFRSEQMRYQIVAVSKLYGIGQKKKFAKRFSRCC